MQRSSEKKYKGDGSRRGPSDYSSGRVMFDLDEDSDSPRFYNEYYPKGRYNGDEMSAYSKGKGRSYNGEDMAYYPNRALKYQTIVLKVQIHCDACIRKVKKAVAGIDGVECITVDVKQKKITVTGHIDPKNVLKKVGKTGKHVELMSSRDNANNNGNNNSSNNNSNNNKLSIAEKHLLQQQQQQQQQHHQQQHHLLQHQQQQQQQQNQLQHNSYASIVERSKPGLSYYAAAPPSSISYHYKSDADYLFSDENANSCSIM